MAGLSLNSVLSEARSLVTKLHECDRNADSLLTHSNTLNEKINSMKQYQENLEELNQVFHHKPRTALIHSLKQENREIRQLQEENRKLKTTLEEYEGALELIMEKYRKQMTQLQQYSQLESLAKTAYDRLEPNQECHEDGGRMRDFASVFVECLKTGHEGSVRDTEEIARLRTENATLRELLNISQPIIQSSKSPQTPSPNEGEVTPKSNMSPVECNSPVSIPSSSTPSVQNGTDDGSSATNDKMDDENDDKTDATISQATQKLSKYQKEEQSKQQSDNKKTVTTNKKKADAGSAASPPVATSSKKGASANPPKQATAVTIANKKLSNGKVTNANSSTAGSKSNSRGAAAGNNSASSASVIFNPSKQLTPVTT